METEGNCNLGSVEELFEDASASHKWSLLRHNIHPIKEKQQYKANKLQLFLLYKTP